MKKILLSLLFVVMTVYSVNAESIKIVAVVNDDIITSYDFYSRVDMSLVNAKLEKTQDNFAKIAPTVLQSLITERLKIQTATQAGLFISDQEIDQALAELAARNEIEKEAFIKQIEDTGLSIDALKSQIEATILWNKYISKAIAPKVEIPDEEIREFYEKVKENEDSYADNKITEDDVRYKLIMEKVKILENRKLRDLKDMAFIEVKMR